MAKQYDATNKQLVEKWPADFVALAGMPTGVTVTVVDADLSTFTTAADKVVRVEARDPYIAHFEAQSGPDQQMDRRVLVYNVLAGERHQLPVRSVVLLLRP